jgi:anti-anti-sigma factor
MSTPKPFQARIESDGVVYLSGDLDMAVADAFCEGLMSSLDGHRPVLDLAELTFLDSSGIRAILQIAAASGVALRNSAPNIRRVLDVAGIEESMGVRIEPWEPRRVG